MSTSEERVRRALTDMRIDSRGMIGSCSGGYPVYRFEDGSILIDKFGNLMFKHEESHEEKNI